MTTKRKLILKAIALAGSPTVDDLAMNTGLQRKNLQDNLKACMTPVALLERIRDDVLGQPTQPLQDKIDAAKSLIYDLSWDYVQELNQ